MRILDTKADIEEGVAYLSGVEPRFKAVIETLGAPPAPRRREAGFGALLKLLVEQQLSVAAAETIWARVEAAGFTTPATILHASEEEMRACGLSRPKIRYAKAVSQAIEAGQLSLEALAAMPAEEAIASLTAIKGVGLWTARIYLMFSIGQADHFPSNDIALQEAARDLLNLKARPEPKTFDELAKKWSPWRTVAAQLLWQHYRHMKNRAGKSGT